MKSGQTPSKRSKQQAETDAANGRDTGAALRSVYQKTIDEAVPSDLLDLLGKLD